MFRESSTIDSERTAKSVRSLYAKYSADENWFTGTPDSVDRRIAQCKKISNAAKAACVRLSGRNVVSQYIALAHEMDGDRTALEGLRRDLLTAATDREAALDTTGWSGADALKYIRENPDTRHNGDQAYMCHCPECARGREREARRLTSENHEPLTDMAMTPMGGGGGVSTSIPGAMSKLMWDGSAMTGQEDAEFNPGPKRPTAALRSEARYFIAEQECDDLRELTIRAQHFAERVSSTLPADQSRQFVTSFVGAVRNEYEPPRQQRTAASNYNTQDFPADLLFLE
jgi:hypothetical protein